MIYSIVICIAVTALDIISKYLVVENIEYGGFVKCIDGVFHLTYIKNRGAAFGMLSEHRWVFMVISVAAIVAFFVYMVKKKPKSMWLKTAIGMIMGGGIGNMIDRALKGYVVDFIEVDFVKFAVFNVADIFVTVSCIMLIVYILNEEKKERRSRAPVAQ